MATPRAVHDPTQVTGVGKLCVDARGDTGISEARHGPGEVLCLACSVFTFKKLVANNEVLRNFI